MRVVWVVVVAAAGLALARGLLLTTHFELTPQAQVEAERGRLWLWGSAATLVAAALVAARLWQVSMWALTVLVAAAPVGLLAEALGWIPLVALVVSAPMLLLGLCGTLLAPRRDPPAGPVPLGSPAPPGEV